ncbi:MAG: hypothetical protein F6K47_16750 [Symploca sp. SIO2E6]|nr:hypothetical protein [Symploca sp. SIO2E6]
METRQIFETNLIAKLERKMIGNHYHSMVLGKFLVPVLLPLGLISLAAPSSAEVTEVFTQQNRENLVAQIVPPCDQSCGHTLSELRDKAKTQGFSDTAAWLQSIIDQYGDITIPSYYENAIHKGNYCIGSGRQASEVEDLATGKKVGLEHGGGILTTGFGHENPDDYGWCYQDPETGTWHPTPKGLEEDPNMAQYCGPDS